MAEEVEVDTRVSVEERLVVQLKVVDERVRVYLTRCSRFGSVLALPFTELSNVGILALLFT